MKQDIEKLHRNKDYKIYRKNYPKIQIVNFCNTQKQNFVKFAILRAANYIANIINKLNKQDHILLIW